MSEEQGEKTEQPTGKRREKFREEGNVAQSKEVGSAALMTFSLLLWYFYMPMFWENLTELIGGLLKDLGTYELTQASSHLLFVFVITKVGGLLAPLAALTLLVGFFSSYIQIGWNFTTKPFVPDITKFNPVTGLGKLVSKRSAVEAVKSLLKVALMGFVVFKTISDEFERGLYLIDLPPVKILAYLGDVAFSILLKASGIMIFLALVDYLYVRWELEEKMKMTKQEVKEEHKDSEGDPQVKGQRKQKQMEMSRKRMMEEVPKADVVITNPTHLSIAIVYRSGEMDAPQIVAKGADSLAMRIREVAKENDVPLVENVPVARALYPLDLGSEVPEELFAAVAEILAYVYNLKGEIVDE